MWSMPWTIDRDICARAVDRTTGEVFAPDDPDAGYDVSFKKEGTGQTTKYVGIDLARRPSPLSDDPAQAQAWLDFVVAHPLPDQFILADADHILKVFTGGATELPDAPADYGAEPAPAPAPSMRRETLRSTARQEKALASWSEIHAMGEDDLLQFIDSQNISTKLPPESETCSLPELADMVCEVLGITDKAPEPAAPPSSSDLKSRMARLRGGK
jgi:hypothetical protein